jgi:outer membrane protein OmpA-like peptidoglycan-associated protein
MPLRILHPCEQSWNAMAGGRAHTRHCATCAKDVHDVTHLSEPEVRGYVRLRGASLCVRMIAMSAAVAACAPSPPPLNVPGPTVAHPATHELPQNEADSGAKDSDGDGVADANDACPAEPGKPSTDAEINGCPARVVLATMGELPILEQIHFAKNKSVIAQEATPLIEETIAALKTSPQIAHLAVEGHASSDEPAAQRLSLERANAVVARMVAGGIDPARLVAKGLGATKPIDSSQSDDARMRNRRIEFRVVDEVATCADAGG